MNRNLFNSVVIGSLLFGLSEVGASSLSYEKQIAAVKQSYYAIQKIENQNKEIQLAAVKQSYNAIQKIEHQDKEIQLLAVKQRYNAISYIKNPCIDATQLACTKR